MGVEEASDGMQKAIAQTLLCCVPALLSQTKYGRLLPGLHNLLYFKIVFGKKIKIVFF